MSIMRTKGQGYVTLMGTPMGKTVFYDLYKMTMNKTIPHYKVGGKVLFKPQELMDFVERGFNASPGDCIDRFDLVSPFSVAA